MACVLPTLVACVAEAYLEQAQPSLLLAWIAAVPAGTPYAIIHHFDATNQTTLLAETEAVVVMTAAEAVVADMNGRSVKTVLPAVTRHGASVTSNTLS